MLSRYYDAVLDSEGNSIASATVTVRDWRGNDVTLYTSRTGATPTSNVLTTDSKGQFAFYAPDGNYQLTIAKTGITTVVRDDVFLGSGKHLNPEWFGIFPGESFADITSGLQDWIYEILGHTSGAVASGRLPGDYIELPYGRFSVGPFISHPAISLGGNERGGTILRLNDDVGTIGTDTVRCMIYLLARRQDNSATGSWSPIIENIRFTGNKANQSNNFVYGIYAEPATSDPGYGGDATGYGAIQGRNFEIDGFSGTGLAFRQGRQRLSLSQRWRTSNHGILDGVTVVTRANGLEVFGNDPVLTDGGAGSNTGHAILMSGGSGLVLHGCNVFACTAAARSVDAMALKIQNANGAVVTGNVFNDTVSLSATAGSDFQLRAITFATNDFRPNNGVFTADGVVAGDTSDPSINAFVRLDTVKNVAIGPNGYNAALSGYRYEYLASVVDTAIAHIEFAAPTAAPEALVPQKPWHTTNFVPIYEATGGAATLVFHNTTSLYHRFSGAIAVGLADNADVQADVALHVDGLPAYFGKPVLLNRPTMLIWGQTVASVAATNGATIVIPDKRVETHLQNASLISTINLELPATNEAGDGDPLDGCAHYAVSHAGVTTATWTLTAAAVTAGHSLIGAATTGMAAGQMVGRRFKASDKTWWPCN